MRYVNHLHKQRSNIISSSQTWPWAPDCVCLRPGPRAQRRGQDVEGMSVARKEATKSDSSKFLMVNNIAYAFGQVTVKISLCLLYRHLFTSTKLHMLIDLTIIYSVLWGIAFIGVAIGSCRPIHAFWDFTLQTLPTTYCINNRAWYLGQAIPNILTDILVLCMPIKQIWGLRLDRKSKSALVLIFALGIL